MEHPEQAERKWVSEEEDEEVVGLQVRRSSKDQQGTPEMKSYENQKLLEETSYQDQRRSSVILNKNTGIDKEVVDFDVESVLEKQETYDLICPHCQSCITKEVILRKREPPSPDTDVFRCSACFGYFTRLGRDCFTKLDCFPCFGVPEENEVGEWDILKSIVYGGLAESITSLGIVSSAAGAAAATLNIMGLALANLIGGLFVILHNLRELRNDSSASGSSRYRDTLGRRDKFVLHATMVIVSFLIFGAIPPIVYGFSFRESDDKDLKLAVVAASSLVCITLLATAKAHVQTPPKSYFKTIFYYVAIGFMASGVSYVAGDLFDRLLKYLGLFESSSAATKLGHQGWAYY